MTIDSLHSESLNTVLDSLADGVYITDLNRKILYWNKAAEQITGWPASEIQGHSCYDNFLEHIDSEGNHLCGEDTCPLHQAIIQKQSNRLPVMVFAKGKNGQRIPMEVTVAPVINAKGEVIGGIESFRDLGPLMEDLKHARTIQLHAMETHQDEDPRIQIAVHNIPYEYVSGDFYRVEKISPDSYAIFIADIMGHGVSSALYAMTIRTVWEEARHLLPNPSAFCSHLNEQLFNMTKLDDSFATAIFGVIDLEAMEFRFVRAGHPPPLLSRNGAITECGSTNQALGFFANGEFKSDKIALQEGDKILAFTDGSVEIINPEGEELGINGLGQLLTEEENELSGMELINKIEQRLLEYSKDMVFSDDVTIAEIEILKTQ